MSISRREEARVAALCWDRPSPLKEFNKSLEYPQIILRSCVRHYIERDVTISSC
jgi:hypothetical protein